MVRVSASCPTCGPQEIPAELLLLVVYPRKGENNYYEFSCQGCGDRVAKFASPAVLMTLSTTTCERRIVRVPAEFFEDHYEGGPLTQDDVLDFMLETQGEDDLAALAG